MRPSAEAATRTRVVSVVNPPRALVLLGTALLLARVGARPAWAALGAALLAGGLLMGTGFLVLFRHHASLGGLNILVLVLQKRFGWRAGWVQMGIDGTILIASLAMVEPRRIAMSILGALALNLTLALNHRPGRYVAF